MSLRDQTTLQPRRNLFNIFEKGKDFFLLRTFITLIACIALLAGCGILAMRSWQVYPTVVRDELGNSFVGQGSTYNESPRELMKIVTVILESLFTKTEKGLAVEILETYFAGDGLSQFINVREDARQFIQRGHVFDMFIAERGKDAEGNGMFIIYAQVDVIKGSFNDVLTDTSYYRLLLLQGERSISNPSGLRILKIGYLTQSEYKKTRRDVVKDSLSSTTSPSNMMEIDDVLRY